MSKPRIIMKKLTLSVSLLAAVFATAILPATAQTTGSVSKPGHTSSQTYTTDEMITVGHQFFGKTTREIAKAVEYVFQKEGEPTAYIVGEEAAGSFVGGLRYGEG